MIKKFLKSDGFALSTILLILALIGVLIPFLVKFVQFEANQSVVDSRKTKSFQLAEAGVDRGAWKLKESQDIWNLVATGSNTITNYNDDKDYNDVAGGVYKIKISSGPSSGQVTVVAKGKASGTEEVRAIRAIFTKGSTLGPMSVGGGLDWRPNLEVHWGSVKAFTAITQSPGQYYPRKYSAGQIVGRDTVNDSSNGAMPGDKWTQYDYASFYSLGSPPNIILGDYRTLAKNSQIPSLRKTTGNTAAVSSPTGSGYFLGSIQIQKPGGGPSTDYSLTCATCVIFSEGNIIFPQGGWLNIRALVAVGDIDFNAKSTNYTATIPSHASLEYQHPTAQTTWVTKGWTDGGTTSIANCGMHGFLYCGGNMTTGAGNGVLVGALFLVHDYSLNTMTIYYDESVAQSVLVENASVTRISWDDIVTAW